MSEPDHRLWSRLMNHKGSEKAGVVFLHLLRYCNLLEDWASWVRSTLHLDGRFDGHHTKVKLHIFFDSRRKWSASCCGHFRPEKGPWYPLDAKFGSLQLLYARDRWLKCGKRTPEKLQKPLRRKVFEQKMNTRLSELTFANNVLCSTNIPNTVAMPRNKVPLLLPKPLLAGKEWYLVLLNPVHVDGNLWKARRDQNSITEHRSEVKSIQTEVYSVDLGSFTWMM
jgi:hypothetical protein